MAKSNNPRRKRATRNFDHARRSHVAAPSDQAIEQRLNELVKPAVYAELGYYRQLGLRNRLLNLPMMVAVVLALIWRRVPGVCTLQRMLAQERVLWSQPTKVSQPALSERLLTFPAVLFERILYRVLARLPTRQQGRSHPQPELLEKVRQRFAACYAVDGTVLEALFRKLKSLQGEPDAPLAGHLVAAVDLLSHLPAKLWWMDDPLSNDKAVLAPLLAWLRPNSLLVFDLGYFAFTFFDALTERDCWFVTRQRRKTSYQVERVLLNRPRLRDRIVHLGKYRANRSEHSVRLIEVYLGHRWQCYLTNVLEPERLSVVDVVCLYQYRWHIETAFLLVKRLLDLAYLWVGSINGVQLQVWATFLFYAILIDLCDEVAEVLQLPLDQISVEMVYRSLYFYVQACANGCTDTAPVFLAREAPLFGIVKRHRPRAGPGLAYQVRQALLTTLPPPQSASPPAT
jgi:hypothetical protein